MVSPEERQRANDDEPLFVPADADDELDALDFPDISLGNDDLSDDTELVDLDLDIPPLRIDPCDVEDDFLLTPSEKNPLDVEDSGSFLALDGDPDELRLDDTDSGLQLLGDGIPLAEDDALLIEDGIDIQEPARRGRAKTKSKPEERSGLQGNSRRDAMELLQGVQGAEEILEIIRGHLGGRRSNNTDELVSTACAAMPVVRQHLRWGFSTSLPQIADSVRVRAELVGLVYFLDRLAQKDPALIEQVTDLLKGNGGDPQDVHGRLQIFFKEEIDKNLAPVSRLIRREGSDDNDLSMTHLLKGILSPYFLVSSKSPEGGVSAFFSRAFGEGVPRALQDLWTGKDFFPRDGQFLKELVSIAEKRQRQAKQAAAPAPAARRAPELPANSKLKQIVAHVTEPEDLIGALQVFVQESEELSLADLYLIAKHLPRGIPWGDKCKLSESFPRYFERQYDNHFVPTDLKILYHAVSKTNNPLGQEYATQIGRFIRQIIDRAKFGGWLTDVSSSEKEHVQTMLLSDFGKKLGEIVDQSEEAS